MVSLTRINTSCRKYDFKLAFLLIIAFKFNSLVSGETQKTSFTQLFFGADGLRPLTDDQVERFEGILVTYANKMVPGTVTVSSRLVVQQRVHIRNPRRSLLSERNLSLESIHDRDYVHKYSNAQIVKRNLNECGTNKRRSITLYYEITWQSSSGDDLTRYSKDFVDWIDTPKGKDSITSSMRDLGICVISARDVKVDQATRSPTQPPTRAPTAVPTNSPTKSPTFSPTYVPTNPPTTRTPTSSPTRAPTSTPTRAPTSTPTGAPTRAPTNSPTNPLPTPPPGSPTISPTAGTPTKSPTLSPTKAPTPPTNAPPSTPPPTAIGTVTGSDSGSFSGSAALNI